MSGPGSTLVTKGTDNLVLVGDEGAGELRVLDGGLVDTLFLDVARSGDGRVVIRGVAADGTRSRVIVSPANGRFSGDFTSLGGFARVARDAGSNGMLEILGGGLLRVLDGNGTHGPEFQLARTKGSAGMVVIDGAGSRLEVIQDAPAVDRDPNVFPGPAAQLARRGGGSVVVRNSGTLLVQGERAFVRVSRDSVNANFPDPDSGPIDQRSVVSIESGGRIEIDGEDGSLVIGDDGPAADGEVVVTGPDTVLVLSGAGNRIVVGDDGGRGTLEARDGGAVRYGELVVGANGSTNVVASVGDSPEEVQEEIAAVTNEILPEQGDGGVAAELDDEEDEEDEGDEESGEAVGVDESGEEERERLPMCPA